MENPSTIVTYIYFLKDINSHEPRYIGKSNNPFKRLRQHKYNALRTKSPTYKQRWIRKVINNDSDIECVILEVCDIDKFEIVEKKWMDYFKEYGYDLTNSDDTGQGNTNRRRDIIDGAAEKISKKVFKFDLNGLFLKEYKSCREAGRVLGISHGNIVKCCNGVFKHTAGYIFRYDRDCEIEPIGEPNAVKKEVVEVCVDGVVLDNWSSISECGQQTNINPAHISRCCNDKMKRIKGRYFRFK